MKDENQRSLERSKLLCNELLSNMEEIQTKLNQRRLSMQNYIKKINIHRKGRRIIQLAS